MHVLRGTEVKLAAGALHKASVYPVTVKPEPLGNTLPEPKPGTTTQSLMPASTLSDANSGTWLFAVHEESVNSLRGSGGGGRLHFYTNRGGGSRLSRFTRTKLKTHPEIVTLWEFTAEKAEKSRNTRIFGEVKPGETGGDRGALEVGGYTA